MKYYIDTRIGPDPQLTTQEEWEEAMDVRQKDSPAFPCGVPDAGCGDPVHFQGGMTLRQYYAGQALARMAGSADASGVADYCFNVADEMIRRGTR